MKGRLILSLINRPNLIPSDRRSPVVVPNDSNPPSQRPDFFEPPFVRPSASPLASSQSDSSLEQELITAAAIVFSFSKGDWGEIEDFVNGT